METKKGTMTKVLLFFAIFIIIILCYFTYKFYSDNIRLAAIIADLNNQVTNLENSIKTLKENNSNNSNTTTTTNNMNEEITEELDGIDVLYVTKAIKNDDEYTLQGVIYTQYTLNNSELQDIVNKGYMTIDNEKYTIKISDTPSEYNLYEEGTENLVYVIKSTNYNSYYLQRLAQISDVWKLTDEYKEITVLGDTKCNINFDYEGEYKTVKDVFENFEETSAPDVTCPDDKKTFNFKFENGKCTEVVSVLTSL